MARSLPCRCRKRWLPTPLPGLLRPVAAEALGIATATPVAVGTQTDPYVDIFAMGVSSPRDGALLLGSSLVAARCWWRRRVRSRTSVCALSSGRSRRSACWRVDVVCRSGHRLGGPARPWPTAGRPAPGRPTADSPAAGSRRPGCRPARRSPLPSLLFRRANAGLGPGCHGRRHRSSARDDPGGAPPVRARRRGLVGPRRDRADCRRGRAAGEMARSAEEARGISSGSRRPPTRPERRWRSWTRAAAWERPWSVSGRSGSTWPFL